MKQKVLIILFVFISFVSFAQRQTQSIHGTVTDKESQSPLPGVEVVVLGSDSIIGTTTDANGKFKLQRVPIGRISLQFTFIGYRMLVLNNIVLDAGKEGIANASLEESVDTLHEVVVHSGRNKNNPLNDMSTVSARQFAPDDATRYAGSLGDPSRMQATNYAGVAVANDTRNDIIIERQFSLRFIVEARWS